MMNMKNNIYALLATAVLLLTSLSCEYRIEMKGVGITPNLYIECYPGVNEECRIRVQKSLPTNANIADSTIPENLKLNVTVNGNPVDVRHVEDKSYESYYAFDYKSVPGDKIRIRGLPTNTELLSEGRFRSITVT